ncbi:MAG: glycosyltransferase [Clostridia bacterium]|nr:glycosyltransferase [Clostridia bacterium]
MKFVFISNFFNHHQKPFSDAMYKRIGNNYCFIETAKIREERLKMGWGEDIKPSYVKQNYLDERSRAECQKLIDEADVVMYGSAPYELLTNRLKMGKLTFKYSERPYKTGCPYYKLFRHFMINSKKYRRYKNLYLLCASAYTSADFAKTFSFVNKAYQWGYFTEVKSYEDVNKLIQLKQPASILWVARFIPLKHPELAVDIAKRLKADGYTFKLNMIGNGELEKNIKQRIQDSGVSDCVEMLGAMKPEQVRGYMEKSQIFLFTSDRNEGWGAVLNESMNSACAVVVNHAIGSVPFLIKDGENGMIYKDGNVDELYAHVKKLLDDSSIREEMARRAYDTMISEWNPDNAAEKLLYLSNQILAGVAKPFPYVEGVCSKAKKLKDNWKK